MAELILGETDSVRVAGRPKITADLKNGGVNAASYCNNNPIADRHQHRWPSSLRRAARGACGTGATMAADVVRLQAQLHKLQSQLDEVSKERETLGKGACGRGAR